jgi:hypothetical protein
MTKTSSEIFRMGDRVQMRIGNATVSVSIMPVSPALAREWLELEHKKNRRTPTVTAKYSAEMVNGGWRPSPEPIVFSSEGALINGGNRLRAVIDSGTTPVFTVWWNWPEDAFACFDRNAPRTIYQADSMTGEGLPRSVYQMGRTLIMLDENRTAAADTEVRRRARALLKPWAALGPTLAEVRLGARGVRAPAALTFCVAWLSDPECVTQFVHDLKAASLHEAVPSSYVKNYIRWYENSALTGKYAAKDNAYATAAALRQAATNTNVSFIKSTVEAWDYWRKRPQVKQALDAVDGEIGFFAPPQKHSSLQAEAE